MLPLCFSQYLDNTGHPKLVQLCFLILLVFDWSDDGPGPKIAQLGVGESCKSHETELLLKVIAVEERWCPAFRSKEFHSDDNFKLHAQRQGLLHRLKLPFESKMLEAKFWVLIKTWAKF